MRRLILFEILRRIGWPPPLARRLKIFVGIGLFTVFLAGGLVVWGLVAGVRHIAGVGQSFDVQAKAQAITTEVRDLPALIQVGCWQKAQTLLSVSVWLEKPIADNLKNLKTACLKNQNQVCERQECEAMKRSLNTFRHGETI